MSTTNEPTTSSLLGLSDDDVAASRRLHGENVLTPPPRTSLWKLYIDKYRDPIIQILLVAAVVSLVLAFVENDFIDRKSTRLNSSHANISYAVFCLKKKKLIRHILRL